MHTKVSQVKPKNTSDKPASRGVIMMPPRIDKFLAKYGHGFFTDHSGQVVIAQRANLPLRLWLIFQAIAFLTRFRLHSLHGFATAAALVSITWWAGWEVFDGVCWWRRALGIVVLVVAFLSAFRMYLS